MSGLDDYLRQASRGLPRAQRRRVREELRGSVLERAAEHQVAGYRAGRALELALREFGDPAPLAAGMRRVHLWPGVGLTGGLASAVLAFTLLALRPSPGSEVLGVQPPLAAFRHCGGAPTACLSATPGDVWLQPEEVAAALNRQGVQARVDKNLAVTLVWQGKALTVPASFTSSQSAIGAAALTGELLQVEPGLRVRGYNHLPTLQAGSVSLTLSPAQGQLTSAAYYRSLGRVLVGRWMPEATVTPSSSRDPFHRLTTTLAPGEVVILVTRNADGSVAYDVAPVGTRGRVRLRSSHTELKLVTSVSELRPIFDPLTPALLVRLTNVPLAAPHAVPADFQP